MNVVRTLYINSSYCIAPSNAHLLLINELGRGTCCVQLGWNNKHRETALTQTKLPRASYFIQLCILLGATYFHSNTADAVYQRVYACIKARYRQCRYYTSKQVFAYSGDVVVASVNSTFASSCSSGREFNHVSTSSLVNLFVLISWTSIRDSLRDITTQLNHVTCY